MVEHLTQYVIHCSYIDTYQIGSTAIKMPPYNTFYFPPRFRDKQLVLGVLRTVQWLRTDGTTVYFHNETRLHKKKEIPKNKVILQFKIRIKTRQTIETVNFG